MTEMPTFNFKNIHIFIISLFAVIFVLSLMGLIKVKNPNAIMSMSFINVFLGLAGWMGERTAYAYEYSNSYLQVKRYVERELIISIVITLLVFFTTLIGLLFQF